MRIRDWSSDVCSSDLPPGEKGAGWEWLFKPKGLDSDFHFSAPFQGQFTPFWCDAWRVQRSLKVNGFCVAEDEIFFPKGLRERRYRIAIAESRELPWRSEEHTSELQSLMRISYAVFCLKKKTQS